MDIKVNGVNREFKGDPNTPLLWVLRDHLNITSLKFGCGQGLCGACSALHWVKSVGVATAVVIDIVFVSSNSLMEPLAMAQPIS